MVYKSIFLPKAKDEVKDAYTWYEKKSKGLGKRFTGNVKQTVIEIEKNPFAFAVKYDNIRTALVNKFPYLIHFDIDEPNKEIIITAVFHTSRNPELWET